MLQGREINVTGGDYKDCMCGQECSTPGVESTCVFAEHLKGEKANDRKEKEEDHDREEI
jgi:hypothetical protein